MKVILGLLFGLYLRIQCDTVEPGPLVIATKGEVWPLPQKQEKFEEFYVVEGKLFEFKVSPNIKCQIIKNAVLRYENIIESHYQTIEEYPEFKSYTNLSNQWENSIYFLGLLDNLNIVLNGKCSDEEYPFLDMSEYYNLTIAASSATLESNSTWGILRGLETFSQLLYISEKPLTLQINATRIVDYPRFRHRGLMLDTSRHFIPLKKILETLDAMAYNKLNVFHWHIVDDQSFPYVSRAFPELSDKGAYKPSYTYSIYDVAFVIEYAKNRGIRVTPEFDTPGHTRSWGESQQDLLAECYEKKSKTGRFGPIDPSNEANYDFLGKLFKEISEVFHDNYVHLGGDEVDFECWQKNPNIQTFMKTHNISTYPALESYYIQKLVDIVTKQGSNSIVWEEVFVNGVILPQDTVVHVWRDSWELTIYNVTSSGRPALLSSCWYLDHLSSGGDWLKYYACDPHDFAGTEEQKSWVWGGEACMWAETVNGFNLVSRIWPRASAPAEKLWSPKNASTPTEVKRRLEEHTCRMNRRRIGAEPPNGPGFC